MVIIMHEALVRALLEALEQGHEVTVTFKPPTKKASPDKKHQVKCSFCEWSGSYTLSKNAQRALRVHSEKCVARKKRINEYPQWLVEQSKGEK